MKDLVSVKDIYIGYAGFYNYVEYYDEYEYTDEPIILEKSKYSFDINNNFKTDVYNYCFNSSLTYYVKEDGSVIFYPQEGCVYVNGIPYQFSNLINLSDLIKKFENDKRECIEYKKYAQLIYDELIESIGNKQIVERSLIEKNLGNIYDLYVYVFEYATEEEYLEAFGLKDNVVDINEYKAHIRKRD